MLRITIVGRNSNSRKSIRKPFLEDFVFMGADAIGNILIFIPQFVFVRFLHLGRQNIHPSLLGIGVLMRHNIVRLSVHVLQQIRRDQKREQLAVLHHPLDIFTETLAGSQELVIPNRNIPILGVTVDQLHELVGVVAVLFAVAQKDVCIKSLANSLSGLIAD